MHRILKEESQKRKHLFTFQILSLLTSDGKTTRVGYRVEDGSKVRVAKKTDEVI